jgi:hypothetical protein
MEHIRNFKRKSKTQKQRNLNGVCEYKATTCQGKLTVCNICNRLLCEYHRPRHILVSTIGITYHY